MSPPCAESDAAPRRTNLHGRGASRTDATTSSPARRSLADRSKPKCATSSPRRSTAVSVSPYTVKDRCLLTPVTESFPTTTRISHTPAAAPASTLHHVAPVAHPYNSSSSLQL